MEWFRYTTPIERKLLLQVIYSVTGRAAYGCVGKYTGRKRKQVGIECTAAERLEIQFDYDFFREALERYFEGGVKIIDSAEACAESARAFLDENSIAASLAKTGNVRYYFTDLPSDFNGGLRRFLGNAPSYMEKAQLE